MTQRTNLTIHEIGQRHGVGHGRKDVLGQRLAAFRKRLVHGINEHGLDLGSRELLAGAGQHHSVEVRGLATVAFDHDVPDLRSLQRFRQIDEEHLVEPSLAQELGRELGHVIGRGDHKHRLVLFLHPAQKRAEHAGRGAAIGGAAGLAAREALLDFIDPQHARRDGLGCLDDGTQVGFRLPDDAAEHPAHVETQQR